MADPYRLCEAGITLRAEINARWPNRDKTSDGWVGDVAHAARSSASDHNPWITKTPPPGMGVVRAVDIDVDGVDMAWLMEHLCTLGQRGDPRLTGGGYLIFNRRITAPDFTTWRVYTGSNPHTRHGHVSFTRDLVGFDLVETWGVADSTTEPAQEGDDMTPDERAMLRAVYQQLAGPDSDIADPKKAWPGWPTWPGGTSERLTLVDLARRGNVETRQAWSEIRAVRAEVTAALAAASPSEATGSLSGDDVERIAVRVAELLSTRLAG